MTNIIFDYIILIAAAALLVFIITIMFVNGIYDTDFLGLTFNANVTDWSNLK